MTQMTLQQATELAMQEHRTGKLARAEQLYRQVIAQNPQYVPALANLALLLGQLGNLSEAEKLWREVAVLQPDNPHAHERLGTILGMQGKLQEAVLSLRRATQLDPNFAQAWANLANALREMGGSSDAVAACRRALELNPGDPAAHNTFAALAQQAGDLNTAIAHYRKSVALSPNAANAHYNLSAALWLKGLRDESLQEARRAAELAPENPHTHNLLGKRLTLLGELTQAESSLRRALRLKPDLADAHNDLSLVLQKQGRSDEALAAARKAVELAPSSAQFHSDLLLSLHYVDADPPAIFQEHLEWARRHARLQVVAEHDNDRDPDRRLRIGFMSPDFRTHAVAYFLEPILAHLQRSEFEVFCYNLSSDSDETTSRFRALAGTWRDVFAHSDEQLSRTIGGDAIDILIDLAGHTGRGRPLVLARKPAPILATYLGYPDTTGLRTVNYRITDAVADPPGLTEDFYTEQLVRLPRTAWCYRPGAWPDVRQRDVDAPITFGSFNNLAKLTPAWIGVWCDVLQRSEGSRITLKAPGFRDPVTQQRIRDRFAAHNIAADRIMLLAGQNDPAEHLAAYHEIDVALDTFPYHGTTTTCEALYMGVPVMTMAGDQHVSRVGASLLSSVGLEDLTATSKEQFVKIAATLAADRLRLRELRSALRQRMKESPLMDETSFTRAFEQALRKMWLTFVTVLLLAFMMISNRAAAQTTRPTWKQTAEGELIFRPFDHAPYPHPSRENGFKGSKQFFAKAGHYDDSTVAVFIPRSYTPGESVNYLVHFHGHMNHVSNVLTIYRLREQLVASGVNAILIVPQGPKDAADSGCGKLELDKNGFAALIGELSEFLQQEGKIKTRAVGKIALSAHSGGYKVAAAILDHGGMSDHITDVFLLDASYGSLEWFAAWCQKNPTGRLVSFFTEHLADENKTLMGLLDKAHVAYARLDESAVASSVIERRKPLFIPTTLAHNEVPMKKDYLKRLLETSGLAEITSPAPPSTPRHPSAP